MERETHYTDEEFWAIERNEDGDICRDLGEHLIWMTPAQREQLSEDDHARADEHDEEMRVLRYEACIEFGFDPKEFA